MTISFTPIQLGRREPLKTPAAQRALADIAKIEADRGHPYWHGDPAAVVRMYDLHRQAFGSAPTGLTLNAEEE